MDSYVAGLFGGKIAKMISKVKVPREQGADSVALYIPEITSVGETKLKTGHI